MLGLLDKKKNLGALIVAARRKEPTVKVTKLEKEPGAVVEKEEDVGLKDQMEVCAARILRAIKEDDKTLLVKALFQLHECVDQAIEEGMDLDEDAGEGEAGEMLEDEGVED